MEGVCLDENTRQASGVHVPCQGQYASACQLPPESSSPYRVLRRGQNAAMPLRFCVGMVVFGILENDPPNPNPKHKTLVMRDVPFVCTTDPAVMVQVTSCRSLPGSLCTSRLAPSLHAGIESGRLYRSTSSRPAPPAALRLLQRMWGGYQMKAPSMF